MVVMVRILYLRTWRYSLYLSGCQRTCSVDHNKCIVYVLLSLFLETFHLMINNFKAFLVLIVKSIVLFTASPLSRPPCHYEYDSICGGQAASCERMSWSEELLWSWSNQVCHSTAISQYFPWCLPSELSSEWCQIHIAIIELIGVNEKNLCNFWCLAYYVRSYFSQQYWLNVDVLLCY